MICKELLSYSGKYAAHPNRKVLASDIAPAIINDVLFFQKGMRMDIKPGSFPKLIKYVRSQLNLTQEELAHELGVSFSTINRWENDQTKPMKIALKQFIIYCEQQAEQKKLDLDGFSL